MEDVVTRFDTSNFELERNSFDRMLPKEKNKKVIRLMKDELGRKMKRKSDGLTVKNEDKKAKRYKKVCHKTRTSIWKL